MIFNIICLLLGLLFIFDLPNVVQTVILGICRWFNGKPYAIQPMLWESSPCCKASHSLTSTVPQFGDTLRVSVRSAIF